MDVTEVRELKQTTEAKIASFVRVQLAHLQNQTGLLPVGVKVNMAVHLKEGRINDAYVLGVEIDLPL
jgi:hypothetical protein